MDRHELIAIFNEIGLLLELQGENPFKSRAYYQAARTVELFEGDLEAQWREGKLGELPGFGDALVKKADELMSTGRLAYLDRLREAIPAGLLELLRVPGLGPKKVRVLYDKLNITSLEELEAACLANRLAELAGFGGKTQANILAGLSAILLYRGKYLPVQVAEEVNQVMASLSRMPGVVRAEVAGSYRRRKEIIKDLDFVIATAETDLDKPLADFSWAKEVISSGSTKVTLRLPSGIQADFRIVPPNAFASAWLHFTGSAEHNTELRRIAKERGMKLNEYGLFDGDKPLDLQSEEAIYQSLGLDFIPPEIREAMGETEAAAERRLPRLLQSTDLLGVLHCHTESSDGRDTLETMASACRNLGFHYLGIADHSRSARYAGGLSAEALLAQADIIDRLNEKTKDFRILKGIECDILPDGGLDYADEVLEHLDYVVASVHANFHMDKQSMTERIIKAIRHPLVTVLGHPTGRLLLGREGYDVDLEAIIEAAAISGTALEFNCHPHRYDLDWRWCKRAVARGVKLAVNPDAHSEAEIPLVYSGVEVIRKGWVRSEDVVNTWDADRFLNWARNKRNN